MMMTETTVTKCMNCGSGMEWEYHSPFYPNASDPGCSFVDYYEGHCSDCGFSATVENDDPDTTNGKYQTRNQLTAFRERKNAPKQRKVRPASNSKPMTEDEAKEALGW